MQFSLNDPELKKEMNVNTLTIENELLPRLESMTSSWIKKKRIMAIIIMDKDFWLKRTRSIKRCERNDEHEVVAKFSRQDIQNDPESIF